MSIFYQITEWRWNSSILTLHRQHIDNSNSIDLDNVASLIKTLEQSNIYTLHIHIDQSLLPSILPLIIDQSYLFRNYHDKFYCYYKWLLTDIEDKVHPYATSSAGASAMILSPDEQSILMVYENAMWKFVTGSNDYNELNLDTALREMTEEVGLTCCPDFTPKVIGLWNIAGRSDDKINDHMIGYVCRATDTNVVLDTFEVGIYKWFKLDDPILIEAIEHAINTIDDDRTDARTITYNDVTYCYPHLLWISNWINHRSLSIKTYGKFNIVF